MVTSLRPVALTISVNEPAVRLTEMVRRVPVNHKGGWHTEDHRIQSILFIRDNKVYEFKQDLGLASQYPGEPFIILSADEQHPVSDISELDRVGTLLDMAHRERMRKPFVEEFGVELPDLAEGFRRGVERAYKEQEAISVFGPAYSKQN